MPTSYPARRRHASPLRPRASPRKDPFAGITGSSLMRRAKYLGRLTAAPGAEQDMSLHISRYVLAKKGGVEASPRRFIAHQGSYVKAATPSPTKRKRAPKLPRDRPVLRQRGFPPVRKHKYLETPASLFHALTEAEEEELEGEWEDGEEVYPGEKGEEEKEKEDEGVREEYEEDVFIQTRDMSNVNIFPSARDAPMIYLTPPNAYIGPYYETPSPGPSHNSSSSSPAVSEGSAPRSTLATLPASASLTRVLYLVETRVAALERSLDESRTREVAKELTICALESKMEELDERLAEKEKQVEKLAATVDEFEEKEVEALASTYSIIDMSSSMVVITPIYHTRRISSHIFNRNSFAIPQELPFPRSAPTTPSQKLQPDGLSEALELPPPAFLSSGRAPIPSPGSQSDSTTPPHAKLLPKGSFGVQKVKKVLSRMFGRSRQNALAINTQDGISEGPYESELVAPTPPPSTPTTSAAPTETEAGPETGTSEALVTPSAAQDEIESPEQLRGGPSSHSGVWYPMGDPEKMGQFKESELEGTQHQPQSQLVKYQSPASSVSSTTPENAHNQAVLLHSSTPFPLISFSSDINGSPPRRRPITISPSPSPMTTPTPIRLLTTSSLSRGAGLRVSATPGPSSGSPVRLDASLHGQKLGAFWLNYDDDEVF
ncbi:hypothetical protein BOTBODRAFT_31514 [Botryobasidium botryosum FD-172 SS1]|uniref:Uncharacterized protein n=1 Tax=Botryobasidium botryosum (strain FD-172 SS1) TaxID=930990 RepID=A0A067MLL5_BOTB1|nr:hypothetical protein BOTBODRAFT_31514 [Botryobasidium botryosum FD-172 SS1]